MACHVLPKLGESLALSGGSREYPVSSFDGVRTERGCVDLLESVVWCVLPRTEPSFGAS